MAKLLLGSQMGRTCVFGSPYVSKADSLQLIRPSHAESGRKALWMNHIPPYCLCASCCAKRTPHLLHRNAPVAQKCSNDSLTKDAHESQFALVPRLPTSSPAAKPKQCF